MKISFSTLLTLTIVFFSLSAAAQEHEYELDESYSISDGATIHLNSNDASVTIRGSDREDVHLTVYRKVVIDGDLDKEDRFKVGVKERNGDLYIKERSEQTQSGWFSSISIDEKEYRITIETPKNISLDIDGDDDQYHIMDIAGNVNLSADDTDVNLQRIGGQQFVFEIDDGTIRLDEGRGDLELDMDDGQFSVERADFNSIKAQADDGRFDITSSLSSNGRYEFGMDDGDLHFSVAKGGGTFRIRHDDASIDTDGSFKFLSQESEEYTELGLDGGNAQVEIQTDDGLIKLNRSNK